jgi:hypothetical protein
VAERPTRDPRQSRTHRLIEGDDGVRRTSTMGRMVRYAASMSRSGLVALNEVIFAKFIDISRGIHGSQRCAIS